MKKRGIFFLVAGPAGVGKTTLLQRLLEEEKDLVKAVSVTTRKPRQGEVDGVAYHFWDTERFGEAAQRGEFLEFAQVHQNYYGTLSRFVEEQLAAGLDVVKDIDVQGVDQIRRLKQFNYPKAVTIFVLPPSKEELHARLKGRDSEDAISLALRIAAADHELERAPDYDYWVVNDSLQEAVAKMKAIRLAEHCRNRGGSDGHEGT
jgi:guanylate kinase